MVVKKKNARKKHGAAHATEVCIGRHRGLVLQGDDLDASQSISTPLVVAWFFQYARSQEELGKSNLPKAG